MKINHNKSPSPPILVTFILFPVFIGTTNIVRSLQTWILLTFQFLAFLCLLELDQFEARLTPTAVLFVRFVVELVQLALGSVRGTFYLAGSFAGTLHLCLFIFFIIIQVTRVTGAPTRDSEVYCLLGADGVEDRDN